jgi:DNA-binding transcriptional ArsR family regulator
MEMYMDLEVMKEKCEDVARLLKQFSHPQRLLILCFLSDGEKQAGAIQEAAGLSQSQTSQFLKRMQLEGLLTQRRVGNLAFFSISNPSVLKLLKSMQKIFCS